MYSPVFLSRPTTSGSPPVVSIMWSDHSFAALASSFALTFPHSRPWWRFMFFSKRASNVSSNSSRSFGDNFFLVSTAFIAVLLDCFALHDHQPNFSRSQRTLTTSQSNTSATPVRLGPRTSDFALRLVARTMRHAKNYSDVVVR